MQLNELHHDQPFDTCRNRIRLQGEGKGRRRARSLERVEVEVEEDEEVWLMAYLCLLEELKLLELPTDDLVQRNDKD